MKGTLLFGAATAGWAACAQGSGTNMYGGPVYYGKPDLATTSAFVADGGGASSFKLRKALNRMYGEKAVTAELKKLDGRYGKPKVKTWVTVSQFAVTDAAKLAARRGVVMPEPKMKHIGLGEALIRDGKARDGAFYAGYLLDHLVTHRIHVQVMKDIDARYGSKDDAVYHQITNQAMTDIAAAAGIQGVKLAGFH